jgi:hypothetical protein
MRKVAIDGFMPATTPRVIIRLIRQTVERVYPTAGGVGASSETNPHVLWVPSQNGFLDE